LVHYIAPETCPIHYGYCSSNYNNNNTAKLYKHYDAINSQCTHRSPRIFQSYEWI